MYKHILTAAASAVFIALLSSCGAKDNNSEKAKADYDKALSDSIESITQQIDSCDAQISVLRNKVGEWLRDFTTVDNPREAAPYMILTSSRGKYPLKSTGLIARINDSGQFELIAALSGKPFESISVVSGEDTATSDVVPNDQALNYRTDALTTVSFTGAKADSIGMLIADNELNPISVSFISSRPVGPIRLSAADAKMISYTYMFYKTNRDMQRLERMVPMLHEKINLIRLHKDRADLAADSAAN